MSGVAWHDQTAAIGGSDSVAVELSESSRVGNSDITRSNELSRVATRESNELLNESDPANHIDTMRSGRAEGHTFTESYDK